ncbi:hypothetical protein OUZ56_008318 [Daphnia magna]|uniref:Uncharacterized protein n=1 Tax=Daphnia magna TaxID=35525 RepID=A0ABR0ACQ2_9CRUS|nr:hypothetical protein OUZ56_008318 [Daphnia magna]
MEHCCVVTKTSVVGLQIFIFFRYYTAVLTISVVSPPVDHTQLHFLRLPVVVVYDFTSSPSSPSRLHLRLHLRLVVFTVFVYVVFVYAITSSPASLSPITDRPQWPSPQGALGNAPVGTSLCRCGGGILRVCIPCNGFRHCVSPDLSSDKSHLVRDP